MRRTIKIGKTKLTLCASLYTHIAYRAEFGRELLRDLIDGDTVAYLQALYVLACEGTGNLPTFDEWVGTLGRIDIAGIITIVSELYAETAKVSKQNRSANTGGDSLPLRADELCVMLMSAGLQMSDFHDITLGMALDILHEKVRSIRRANGENIPDPEEQYRIALGNLPDVKAAYEAGGISENDYKRYIDMLKRWEAD